MNVLGQVCSTSIKTVASQSSPRSSTEFHRTSQTFQIATRVCSQLCKLLKSQLVALQTFQTATRGSQGISTANGRNLMTVQGISRSVKEFQRIPKNSKPICFNFPPVPKKNDCSLLKSRGVGKATRRR